MCVLVERQEEGRGVDQIVCRGHQRLAIRGRPAAELGLHDWHGVHACSPLSSRAAAATASREASALCSKGGSCPLPRAHGEAARHISAATRESSAISAAAASASSTLFTPHAGCLEGWLRSRIGRPPTRRVAGQRPMRRSTARRHGARCRGRRASWHVRHCDDASHARMVGRGRQVARSAAP